MKLYLVIGLTLTTIFYASLSAAQDSTNACINKPANNNKLLKQSFDEDKWSDLRAEYVMSKVYTEPKSELALIEESCKANNKSQFPKLSLYQIIDNTKFTSVDGKPPEKPEIIKDSSVIKKECVSAALKRFPANNSFSCIGKNKTKAGFVGGKNPPCVTEDMSDFVSFSVNKAINCMSSISKFDPKTILKKFNTETGFNPTLSSSSGKGLGQLTTPAINEMTFTEKKGGRGSYVLKKIKDSPNPECDSFKEVAKKDYDNRSKVKLRESCDWLGFGDGLTRNLIYSIGYYITLKEVYVKNMLISRKAKKLLDDENIVNELASIAYGREGLRSVKELFSNKRVNANTTPEDFAPAVASHSKYLGEYKQKMSELLCLKDNIDPNNIKKCNEHITTNNISFSGDSCINQ